MTRSARMIRERVLRAIALNREPGFHFIGNLAEVSFESTAAEAARVVFSNGPHVADADGQANIGVVAMLADMALAASIRAHLHPATRLATVSMALQLTGRRFEGEIEAVGEFQGFLGAGTSRQGLSRAILRNPGGTLALAQGAFMPLEPAPGVARFPLPRAPRMARPVPEEDLSTEERRILHRAEKMLDAGEADFLRRVLGYEPKRTRTGASATMPNGSHASNRVGHVQGGLLMGLAATTACAALPSSWPLSAISAYFVSPGQGKSLHARTRVVHHGLMTAVLRTEVRGPGGRRVLEATTTHARR
ncbi:MAG TPA: acyl-CoA thioesterase domain-containing protein [Usitatibacter sp.]|nr:acyl-CoA thioesterase domain-containing protein [Usitatibacter sp.]